MNSYSFRHIIFLLSIIRIYFPVFGQEILADSICLVPVESTDILTETIDIEAAAPDSIAFSTPIPETFDEEISASDDYDISNDSISGRGVDFISALEKGKKENAESENRNWFYLLKKGKLHMNDTTVEYPRFMRFCVNVYNWADRVFNSYDSTYVVGTGRRWKARVLSDNWVDSYAVNFKNGMPIRIMSDIYCSLGAYIQYMAVSVGYSLDMSNIIGHRPDNHKKLEFGFNCARFNIEMHYWENTGGSYLRKFGDYNNGRLFKQQFPGLTLKLFDVAGYYFFNNRKYSQGAAYNFSKFQKRNAGSFMIGFSYQNIDYNLDLTQLPYKFVPFLTIPRQLYRLHYYSYCITGGYGFNWVLHKNLLYNFTVMPELGFTHCYEDSYEGSSKLLAMNFKGRMSLTYNIKDFFICLIGKIDGNWYKTGISSFFSSIENASLSLGVRF